MISGVSRSLPPTRRMPQGVPWPSRSRTTANSCSLGLILATVACLLVLDPERAGSQVHPIDRTIAEFNWDLFIIRARGALLQSVKRFVRSQSCSSTNFKIQFVFLFAAAKSEATAAAAEAEEAAEADLGTLRHKS